MTKITETTPVKKYVGNGTTKEFPFGFMFWSDDEITVQLDGVKQTSGYTITSDDTTKGGTVVFTTAPADQSKIIINRRIENKRYSEFEESGLFRAAVVNDELNRIVAQIQQLEEASSRSVQVNVNDDKTPEELLAEVYNKLDSATEIAADARTAADTATEAANTATKAASEAVSNITSAVDEATASINQTVSASEASIEQTINSAITDVTEAATSAAQEVVDSAAESATQTAKANLDTYVDETVAPSLQSFVDAAQKEAGNAAEKQAEVDASATNAANSAKAAAASAAAAGDSQEAAETAATNAKNSELTAQALAERVRSEGIPMSVIEQRRIVKTDSEVRLWWQDPRDTIIDGYVLASWKSTTIVKKQGSYPEDVDDGTVVEIITTRDKYLDTPLVDAQADAANWYYRAFPLSVNGVYCLDKRNCFGAVLFGYRINETDPVPATRVEYLPYCDNAFYDPCVMDFVSDLFNWGSWRNAFFIPKPCAVTYAGAVDYYLDPDDFTLKEDGTASDVADSAYGGNFMVEFPAIFVKVFKENNYINVLVSNVKLDDGFECWSCKKADGSYSDAFYLPMFEGTNIDSKLRSIATTGKPTGSTNAETEATLAEANGSGWTTTWWADEMTMMLLFPLLFKSTDSQSTLGYGASGSTSGLTCNNNAAVSKGLMYGTSAGSAYGVTYLGMHNWYGHRWRRPNGLMNASGNIKVKMTYSTVDGSTVTGFNRTGDGYIATGFVPPAASSSYINRYEPLGGGKYGIVPKATSGSSSTYYCDGMWTNNGQLDQLILGGSVNDGLLDGVFCFSVNNLPSNASWYIGGSPALHKTF